MNAQPWLHIIKDKRFTTGATLPYLIGAMRLSNGTTKPRSMDEDRVELRALLEQMRDDLEPPDCIEIVRCRQVDSYVASWRTGAPQGRARIESERARDRVLHSVTPIGDTQVVDMDTLVVSLWTECGEAISAGMLSRKKVRDMNGKERNEWVPIDDAEAGEIRETLSNPSTRTRTVPAHATAIAVHENHPVP